MSMSLPPPRDRNPTFVHMRLVSEITGDPLSRVAAAYTDDPWQEADLRSFSRSFVPVVVALLLTAAPASSHVAHTVAPGETLWSVAAASNLTTRTVAAVNGLPEDAQVVAGSTIYVPSEAEGAAALGTAPASPATEEQPAAEAAPPVLGAYTVKAGDSLSGIAAASGVSLDQLAWMNGVDPAQPLLTGTALKLPAGAPAAQEAPGGTDPPAVVPDADPRPVPGSVTAGQIGAVATTHGVQPALAAAVAWQESGFQNGVVSPANARGVMQILPGTWTWIEQQLAGRDLDATSPVENVNAGVMYLRQLIADSGGDETLALASYYQGAASVRTLGLLPDTQRYVANVTALKARFGG
jgi:N-acetylmuramoyl-L-alanine amidase